MSLLARKITRSHWPNSITKVSKLGADAITLSLKTSRNAMSTYEISSANKIDDAFLAISSNFQRLESFDIVTMDKDDLKTLNIDLMETPGRTPIKDLQNKHMDVYDLRYRDLGTLANYISNRIINDYWKRRSKSQLKTIINKAIADGRIKIDTLEPRLIQDLQ